MSFRTDIQALRGLAVLQVVLFHAGHGYVQAGYLGVDIFFVVSGFLITGMIAGRIERGNFSFAEFYFSRAKRLLPAAYVTFFATTIASYYLLDSREWKDFEAQLAGAVSFTGNFVLLSQTGYFEGNAALKPLLHVWSLAIEEQYYLLWPAALVLVPRRYWLAGAGLILGASLALQLALTSSHPSAAFYLLPTRAWELALGSLAALAARRDLRWAESLVAGLFWPALLVLLALPIHPFGLGGNALLALVCCATVVVVLRRHALLNTGIVSQGFAKIGDFSYSLYLIHWPVFAFVNNVYAGDPALGAPSYPVLAAATGVAVIVAYLLYRAVELPVRRMVIGPSRPIAFATLATSAMLVLVPYGLAQRAATDGVDSVAANSIDRRDNVGFAKSCDTYEIFSPLQECRSSDHPGLMVWGDSFAMQLVPGIAASSADGIIQATKSACGPLLGLAQIAGGVYSKDYAARCLVFNRSVLDYLAATPSIKVVVLSSPFYPYFDVANRRLLQEKDGQLLEQVPSQALALAALLRTIERIRALDRRVVLVAPPPSTGFDYTHCLERRQTSRSSLNQPINCNIPLAEYRASKAEVLGFLNRVRTAANVEVISFADFLCSKEECATALQGTFLYRDEGHFSFSGSRIIAEQMHLGALIEAKAR